MRHAVTLALVACASLACSGTSDDDPVAASGGVAGGVGSGGAASGGAASGGASSGGAANGGAGGAASGGTANGGAGGAASGGTSNGGAASGGKPSGGAASGGKPSGGAGGAPSSFDEAPDGPMKGIVAAHNQARASVSPPASTPLPDMSWDPDVAADAAAWAAGCKFAHDPKLGALKQGQNLYASSGSTPTPQKVVGSWVSEVADYDYATNKCDPGKQCGHYTQVVWAKSTGLGCAQKTCTTGSPFGGGKWDLWVCNYSPPGNYNGQKPY